MSITIQHTKEQLCNAHLTAVAAIAGVNLRLGAENDYGVDGQFRSVDIMSFGGSTRRRDSGFCIDFQAKASVCWVVDGTDILYDLEKKTYNDLVARSCAAATFIVVLLCLPRVQADWHLIADGSTRMRNACYWLKLEGEPTTNAARKRVRFPMQNLLTPANLNALLAADRAAREAMFDE